MFKAAVGHSEDPDAAFAAAELIEQCQLALGGLAPKAGLLLAAVQFEHQVLLDALHAQWADLLLIGCSTDGEMSSELGFCQDSVTLILFASDSVQFASGVGRTTSNDPQAAGRAAVEMAQTGLSLPPKLCITLPEALTTDSLAIVQSIKDALGLAVPVVGGLAADQWQFKTTYQFHGQEVLTDAVPVLLFAGDLMVSHGVASGWTPIGKSGLVTHSEGNVLHEIDGAPALQYYREYLGNREPSSQYPLAVFDRDGSYYLRAPSGEHDVDAGTVTFFSAVPEGASVQMTEATRDDILGATRASMQQALDAFPGQEPEAVMFFSCASRRQILGTRTKLEYEHVSQALADNLQACGFYTNGEISPQQAGGETHFHNETFITLVLGTS